MALYQAFRQSVRFLCTWTTLEVTPTEVYLVLVVSAVELVKAGSYLVTALQISVGRLLVPYLLRHVLRMGWNRAYV